MSISMECFESHGHFATYDAYPRAAQRELIFEVQCHFCGYVPLDNVIPRRSALSATPRRGNASPSRGAFSGIPSVMLPD